MRPPQLTQTHLPNNLSHHSLPFPPLQTSREEFLEFGVFFQYDMLFHIRVTENSILSYFKSIPSFQPHEFLRMLWGISVTASDPAGPLLLCLVPIYYSTYHIVIISFLFSWNFQKVGSATQ